MKGKSWISKNYETGISYQIDLNDSLCAMTLVRVVPMLNGIVSNTDFHSIRMQRLGKMFGFKADFLFTIKCMIKIYPISVTVISFFGSVFIFAFAIRVCEL
jgi:hypothetical protein